MRNDAAKKDVRQTEDFWRTTWERWGAGALSEFSPSYQKAASVSFDRFLRHAPDVKNRSVRLFLRESSPQAGEFLISIGGMRYGFIERTYFVLTNLRLFIRNRVAGSYDTIFLSEVTTAQVSTSGSGTVRIVKHSGEEVVYHKLALVPTEPVLQKAIAQSQTNAAWDVQAGQRAAMAVEPSSQGGIFAESDYVPFMLGVFVIGGLVGIPVAYGLANGLGYLESLPWSLLSCLVCLLAFRRDGTISWERALPAIAVSMIGISTYNRSTGRPAFVAGGVLGFLLVVACGYIGVGIGRILKPKNG